MREHCECGHPQHLHNGDGCFADPDWCECVDYLTCEGPAHSLRESSEIWCNECLRWVLELIEDAG